MAGLGLGATYATSYVADSDALLTMLQPARQRAPFVKRDRERIAG